MVIAVSALDGPDRPVEVGGACHCVVGDIAPSPREGRERIDGAPYTVPSFERRFCYSRLRPGSEGDYLLEFTAMARGPQSRVSENTSIWVAFTEAQTGEPSTSPSASSADSVTSAAIDTGPSRSTLARPPRK